MEIGGSPFALLVTSAVLHAGWNLLGKRRSADASFFLRAHLCVLPLVLPLALWWWKAFSSISGLSWLVVLASGAFETLYFFALAAAYRRGDLSVVYPVARGLPVAIVALVSVRMGWGQPLRTWGWLGCGGVLLGCVVLPLRAGEAARTWREARSLLPALLGVVAGTSAYTLLDDRGTQRFGAELGVDATGRGLVYLLATVTATTLCMSAASIAGRCLHRRRVGGTAAVPQQTVRSLQSESAPSWREALATGVAMYTTYGLVLIAMPMVDRVSYVIAYRQLSIPIGVALGALVLREKWTAPKVIGTSLMLAGLALICCKGG